MFRNEIDDGFILEDDCTPGAFTLGWKIFVWLNFSVMFLFPFLVSLRLVFNKAITERQLLLIIVVVSLR